MYFLNTVQFLFTCHKKLSEEEILEADVYT